MTGNETLHRLAPYIQRHIYDQRWASLREVQARACEVIFDTDYHLLLASGTASGKTEAALFPALTVLDEQPSGSVGIIYIGPTKALINDQFLRLETLLAEAGISAFAWHGDVSASKKSKFLKKPRGVLQITPESLENLLRKSIADLQKLFGDLRFVIIDEVHWLMSADRGIQLLSQLGRLKSLIGVAPRRIGLSATLGDYQQAESWLSSGSPQRAVTVSAPSTGRELRLAMELFKTVPNKDGPELAAYDRFVFEMSQVQKCLIFANSRGESERIIGSLREIAGPAGEGVYHAHHGSLSKEVREHTEAAMKAPNRQAITAATVTLEIGVDIGHLDRAVQIGAPYSVSSFLQRIGRTGRRGQPQEMCIVCRDTPPGTQEISEIPWEFLRALAILQLYLEEQWIEPIRPVKFPWSVLYHQTMNVLYSQGEMTPPRLAQELLTLGPFTGISTDDYRELLLHLIAIDHIEKTSDGKLRVGLAGERVVNHYGFCTVFKVPLGYKVRCGGGIVGELDEAPPPGRMFALGGRSWRVTEVHHDRRLIVAVKVPGRAGAAWRGNSAPIHTRILRKIRQILAEDTVYPYLLPTARSRLLEARNKAAAMGLLRAVVRSLDDYHVLLVPWVGTAEFETLDRILRIRGRGLVADIDASAPHYLIIKHNEELIVDFMAEFDELIMGCADASSLITSDDDCQRGKYDRYLPRSLLCKAYAEDHLHLEGLQRDWKSL